MLPGFKVVIDTNVFVSATIFKGEANRLVDSWQRNKFTFLMSGKILDEYIKVLAYPKFKLTDDEIKYIIESELLPFITPCRVEAELDIIKCDISDNKFLALALTGEADYIVSGDKHFLDLGKIERTRIVSLKKFLSVLKSS